MSDPSDRGWGPGWPSTSARKDILDAKCGNNRVVLPIRREIAFITDHLIRALEKARGRSFVQYGCWGYNNRSISGTRVPSVHSWGLAIDLDAPHNPQGSHGYGTMPINAGAIAKQFGFQWGGSTRVGGAFSSTPDPMHFEYVGTPAQAFALTIKLKAQLSAEDDMDTAELIAALNSQPGRAAIRTAVWYSMMIEEGELGPKDDASALQLLSRVDNRIVESENRILSQVDKKIVESEARIISAIKALNL